METYIQIDPTQKLDPYKAVKKIPLEEYLHLRSPHLPGL